MIQDGAAAIGVPEIAGAALFIVVVLDRVFAFIKYQDEKKKAAAEEPETIARERKMLEVMQDLASLNGRNLDLMEKVVPLVEAIHRTTDTYEKTAVCPLTTPAGQERVVHALGKEVRSKERDA